MAKKVKLSDTQSLIIETLSKELELSIDFIADFLIEMGCGYIIAMRKGKDDSSLLPLQNYIEKHPKLVRLSQRLEAFYDAGKKEP